MALIEDIERVLADETVVDPAGALPVNGQFVTVTVDAGELEEGRVARYGAVVTVFAAYETATGAHKALGAALGRIVPKLDAEPDIIVDSWGEGVPLAVNDASPAQWVASEIAVRR